MIPNDQTTVLVLGATGRTGSRVLAELVQRGVHVRAIVRSLAKVHPDLRHHPRVSLLEGEVLAIDDATFRAQVAGCDAVISCLGHVISLRGVFGAPRRLVTRAVERVRDAVVALSSARPVRLALMSSVSVNRPARADTRRGRFERAFVALIRWLIPPARDNQTAADVLTRAPASLEWVVVRPDTLKEGDACPHTLHEGLVATVFSPRQTHMSNVARFLADLATDDALWGQWRGRMPVIVDALPAEATLPAD
ncbi:MAG: SDR family oxidoreductase, partial [Deltaproteobacteria bacterium]|nr:SDR family oxidoreductase [Deltaproteobacteria bacterium]